MRLDLGTQTDDETAFRVALQIPGLVGDDHRAARKGDGDRGHQSHPLGRQSSERQRGERIVPQFVAGEHVNAVFLGLASGLGAGRPIVHRQSHRYAHRCSPSTVCGLPRGLVNLGWEEESNRMGSLTGKVIIVTGASRGIGAAAAVALAARARP